MMDYRQMQQKLTELQSQVRELRRRLDALPHQAGQAGPGKTLRVFEARVVEVHDNYITCKRWQGGELVGTEFDVAKWPELRPEEWDGASWTDPVDATTWTFTRTGAQERQVSDGTTTVDQVVVPRYMTSDDTGDKGSLILCAVMRVEVDPDSGSTAVECTAIELSPRWFAEKQ